MPQNKATLAFASETDTDATFDATYEGKPHDNPYALWVSVTGHDSDGVPRSQGYAGIRWNELNPVPDGTECSVTVAKNLDPAFPVVSFAAFVVVFPDMSSPVSNTVTFA